jgi:type I restriction enzyme, S subunit
MTQRPGPQSEGSGTSDASLPIGWAFTTLGALGQWVGGGTPSKSNPQYWEGGTIPWVSPKDMKVLRVADTEDHITAEAVASSSTRLTPPGTVMLVVRSGILQRTLPVAVADTRVTMNQDMRGLVPAPGIESLYVAYYLIGSERRILDTCSKDGTTVASLETDALMRFPIPLAPSEEQRRLVAAIEEQFTRLDAAVASLKRARANLKRYRAAVLKAACEGRLVPQDLSDEPASVLLERILAERRAASKDQRRAHNEEPTPSNTRGSRELPTGWTWASTAQLAEVETGATPLRSRTAYYQDGTIPWVTSGALNELYVDEASEHLTPLAIRETNAKLFPTGSLLVAMYGEGKTRGKVSELRIDAATNQACAALLFNGSSIELRPYVKLFFRKNYDDIRRLSSGGVQPNLNLSIVRQTVIPLPPLQEQHRIVAEAERRLSTLDQLETYVQANIQRSNRLRQAILTRAFAGRMVPQDPADEPASVLLDRIRAVRQSGALTAPPNKVRQASLPLG